MQVFDLHHNSESLIALDNQTIPNSATIFGNVIDTKGFTAVEFLIVSTTVSAGTFIVFLEHDDVISFDSPPTVVAAANVLGTVEYNSTEDFTPKRLGYIGKKQFVRIVFTADASGNGGFSSTVLLANAKHQATSN